jgi:putative endonuclease
MVMKRGGCVYIMTNVSYSVFYTGVSANLIKRVDEHKSKLYPNSFTAKYKCDRLVFYCFYPRIEEAIRAEKQIKAGSRQRKIDLIKEMNPEFKDLYPDLLV